MKKNRQRSALEEGSPREHDRLYHGWQADFWVGVLEYSRGNMERYQELMKKVGTLTWEDFDQDKDLFLSKVWQPEFFLARYESERHNAVPNHGIL